VWVIAPGSLMIDVFIRANFTADSNAMMAGFLLEFAQAERAVGNATRADELAALAQRLRAAMNARLWSADDDHFVTQLNPDGSTRDFVDYDSNLIAVAHGVPNTTARSQAVLARVDRGRCSAASGAGPQFVSEKWYGTNDTTHGNTGDSWCSMGRIAWFDAHARKLLGRPSDLAAFDAQLSVLQRDLIANTWMHERYGCDGNQQLNRTSHYFEYPSTVAMLLREVRYGIELGYATVTIDPFGPRAFNYHVGNVNVDYGSHAVSISVPGAGERLFTVKHLAAATEFSFALSGACAAARRPPPPASSDASGTLSFSAAVGVDCIVSASASH
jgi:hypothetical protein